jgi:hypothetical protein
VDVGIAVDKEQPAESSPNRAARIPKTAPEDMSNTTVLSALISVIWWSPQGSIASRPGAPSDIGLRR